LTLDKIRMKKKTVRWSIMVFVPFYLLSYLCFTLNGYYAPRGLGLKGDKEGNLHMAPKFGYRWLPFRDWDYQNPLYPSMMNVFYFPLVKLDLLCWHTAGDVESLNHPVRRFLDSSDNIPRNEN